MIGMLDDTYGEAGHAFIITESKAMLSEEDVLRFCREKLAGYKIPRKVTFCQEFPRTPLGKVRKFLLQQNCTGD